MTEIPEKYQRNTREIPEKYQRNTREIPEKYQRNNREIPEKYQRNTREIPGESAPGLIDIRRNRPNSQRNASDRASPLFWPPKRLKMFGNSPLTEKMIVFEKKQL
ncbi:MAG: hypothetical protein PHQ75_13835 [Thermoguttaceae bacterium]|nr:hypothetical protein [Thermoguttaceae bacterium]